MRPAPLRIMIIAVVVALALGVGFVVGASRSGVRSKEEAAAKQPAARRHEEGGPLKLSAEQRRALGIKTQTVELRVPETGLTVTGKIAPNADRTVAITSRTPGRVVKVQAQLGDTVEAGATLALVDSVEAADALGELTQSELALALAESEYEREKLLVERKIAARKDLIRAEAALAQARAQQEKVRAKLHLFGFTDAVLADARQRTAGRPVLVPLLAPFRGTVIERQTTEGQLLDAAAVPFRLADLSTVWALLDVPESDAASVRVGQEAVIETGRESKRGYAGRVVFIGDVVEEQARAVKVRVEIPNAERRFKPGMFITARLVSRPSGPGVVMVPRDAVMLMDEGPVVFIDRGEVIEPRPVEVGAEAGGWLPVRKGVAAGEKVITEGAFALKAQVVKAKLGED